MEERDAMLFQPEPGMQEHGWNIVELESRRKLRKQIHELIAMARYSSLSTAEIRQHLLQSLASYGSAFATQLVRSLHRDDDDERDSVVWLLTVLNEPATIAPLQQIAHDRHLPRSRRLSAALALAGMGISTDAASSYQSEYSQHSHHTQRPRRSHRPPRQLYPVVSRDMAIRNATYRDTPMGNA